jgi:drug/metabolite transporter (DMT)-like permease
LTPESILSVLLALSAAVLFGTSSVIAKWGLRHLDPQTGSLVSIGTTLVLYTISAPLWMKAAYWTNPGVWVFALAGLIHPLLSMYLALEATVRAGPTIASTFASTAPLFAAVTAVAFLGESLTVPIAIGTLATVAGIMTVSWGPAGMPRLLRVALVLATGVAVIRGLNHTIGKWGLELLPSVFMASFVSFAVSFVGALALYRARRGPLLRGLPRAGVAPFLVTGTFIGVAILCMYGGLSLGRVVVVSPIVNTYPLFALLAGIVIREESVTTKLVLGVLLVVSGVALIGAGATR